MSSAPTVSPATDARRYTFLAIGLIAPIVTIFLLLAHSSWPREAVFMAGIFVLAATLWATEALPLFATALLVLGLEIILLSNPGNWPGLGFSTGTSPEYQRIVHTAADPILLLFFGGFLLAHAAAKEGVDRAVSSRLLGPFEKQPKSLLLGVLCVTAVFSMWMSNTATAAMMITLVAPIVSQLPHGDPFRKALILSVAVGANVGGLGTPIASPPNAVAVGFLRQAGYPLGFLDWMLIGVPLMAILLLISWLLLWKLFPPHASGLKLELTRQKLTGRAAFVVGVFVTTVVLWLSEPWHGLPAPVVALLPAIALTASGILNRDDLNRLPWNILILIGGGIALGAGMRMSGLDSLLVRQLPSGLSGMWLLATLVIATLVIGTFMSNTAIANLLLPIGISTAGSGSPVIAAVGIALAAGVTMALPISTPPNAIAYASGEITTRDLARIGTALGIAALALILLLLAPLMRLLNLAG